jgi:MFS family permease
MAVIDRIRGRGGIDDDHDDHDLRRSEGTVRDRQHEAFGGFNLGAAIFGWLVAIGVGVILTALLSAAGAAIGLTELSSSDATQNAETISLVGAIALVVIALIAYYCGGYVAGRLSRFDGGRQGFGVWIIAAVIAIALAVLGAIAGSEYNVFNQLNLPRIPVDQGTLTTGGGIALAAIVLGSLLAAVAGGKAGEAFHRRVDRAGYVRDD